MASMGGFRGGRKLGALTRSRTDASCANIDTVANDLDGAATRGAGHAADLRKEGYTMALYIAVCLLAALLALPETASNHLIGLVWGITIGLAAAHFFAFRVSARLVGAGRLHARDVELAAAQLTGAAAVAALATIVMIVFPAETEDDAAELALSGFIGCIGFVVARRGGAGTVKAIAYGLAVLVLAVGIALLKNALSGH